MAEVTPEHTNHDQLLEAVIAECIRTREAGGLISRRDVLIQYPDLARELKQFLDQQDWMDHLAEPIRKFSVDLLETVGPGRQIDYVGNYELLEEIARGGMGIVYKARQTTLNRLVAVKLIAAGKLATADDVQRFQIEAQAAAGLQHPNVVSIHEVGQHEGWHYFSMDFVEGRSLSAILREHPLPAKQAATYVRQMAEAIYYAHQQGTLHRDLKPSNVLIDLQDQVRITDFGLAMRIEDDCELTRTGQIVGTPSYMPPEQAQGKRSLIGPGSDVYALGAVLYECLTGRAPFRADSVVETIQQVVHVEAPSPCLLNPAIARDLETICLKCLEKEPFRRYGTAQLLADDLGRFLRGEPISARPISRVARLTRWCRRKPLLASLSAATVLSLIGIATVSTLGYWREADLRQTADEFRSRAEIGERDAVKSATDLRDTLAQLSKKHIELSAEQTVTRQLNVEVSDLQKKRQELTEAIEHSGRDLAEQLVRLARIEWLAGDVVQADQYLEKCPEQLRGTEWHRLKRLWLPPAETFAGHSHVAFNPDATLLAMAGTENSVQVRDAKTHNLVYSLMGHTDNVTAVAFSSDGMLLASGSRDRTVRVWNLADGKLSRTLDGHSHPVSELAFSRGGTRLATATFNQNRSAPDGEVIIWNCKTFQEERRLPGYGRISFGIGHSIAILGNIPDRSRAEVQVWNLETLPNAIAQPSLKIPVVQGHLAPFAFSPDGQAIAVINVAKDPDREAASLEIWSLSRRELQQRLSLDFQIHSLAFSPDAKRLACGGRDGFSEAVSTTFKIVTFNLITGERDRIFPWYRRTITDVVYDRDCRQLATATAEGIKVWDVTPASDPTQAILANIPEHNVGPGDWPQWGGSRSRINTPVGRNIPIDWNVGFTGNEYLDTGNSQDPYSTSRVGKVPKGSRNIKWAVPLGSQSYGNPVVANGRVFVGTNNGAGYLARHSRKVDLGVLLCFEEQTGNFLWQHSNPKLPTGRVNDWPLQGVCSTPVIDGERLWYVTNRGEIVCLDTAGYYDGEDDGEQRPAHGPAHSNVVFRIPAKLHMDVRRILAAFEEAGVPRSGLPDMLNFKRGFEKEPLRVGRHSWVDHSWTLFPSHELVLQERFVRVKTVASGKVSGELFTRDDEIFPGLENAEIDDSLRRAFQDAGVLLPESSRLEAIENASQWSITGIQFGKPQTLQLKLAENVLTCTRPPSADDLDEADVVWKFDMIANLGVHPHNMSNCSMITVDNKLFVCTSNGVDDTHRNIPAPQAPSFIAIDRVTGNVLWTDNSPGTNILHAQWASPSYGVFEGQAQVIFPGGDGWVYSFDPKGDGNGGSRLLWKFDTNPKESEYRLGGRATRNQIISFPAIYDDLVYVVVGEDPEHGEGVGHLWCIDPAKRMNGADVSAELAVDQDGNTIPHRRLQAVDSQRGERAVPNPNSAVRWHHTSHDRNGNGKIEFDEEFHRSLSIPVIKDDILYIADFSGLFHCLNAKTGKFYWNYDLLAACWGSALLVDGHVYICDEDGDVNVFNHSADPNIAMRSLLTKEGKFVSHEPLNDVGENQCNMRSPVYMTPIVANNVLYIATKNMLFAIQDLPEQFDTDPPDATKPSN